MLTHSIEKYSHPPFVMGAPGRSSNWRQMQKPRYIVGSDEHKKHIYARTVEEISNTNQFDPNNVYSVKGDNCTVMQWVEYEKAEWDGLKCCLIEVFFDDTQDFQLVHPSDLKKPRSK